MHAAVLQADAHDVQRRGRRDAGHGAAPALERVDPLAGRHVPQLQAPLGGAHQHLVEVRGGVRHAGRRAPQLQPLQPPEGRRRLPHAHRPVLPHAHQPPLPQQQRRHIPGVAPQRGLGVGPPAAHDVRADRRERPLALHRDGPHVPGERRPRQLEPQVGALVKLPGPPHRHRHELRPPPPVRRERRPPRHVPQRPERPEQRRRRPRPPAPGAPGRRRRLGLGRGRGGEGGGEGGDELGLAEGLAAGGPGRDAAGLAGRPQRLHRVPPQRLAVQPRLPPLLRLPHRSRP